MKSMSEAPQERVGDDVDGQLLDGPVIKTRHPAARKQHPVRRTEQVREQARLLWNAMVTYAHQQQQPAEGGFYLDARVLDIAKPIFRGVWWEDPKHVSNFLRPILSYLERTGNIRIIRRADGSNRPFHYWIWIRDEWSTKKVGVSVDSAPGANVRAAGNIPCACGRSFLTAAGFSQHKRSCEAYLARNAHPEPEPEEDDDPFVPIPGVEGMQPDDYDKVARADRQRERRALEKRANQHEAVLRSLQRDWRRRTPESLANLFATLDKLTF